MQINTQQLTFSDHFEKHILPIAYTQLIARQFATK
jgi:hypothetical protein